MLKKIFSIALVVVITLTASFTLEQEKKDVSLSDVMLNNVEALANESGTGSNVTVTCNRNPVGEGRCWAVNWVSMIGGIHCYRVDDPKSRCVEMP